MTFFHSRYNSNIKLSAEEMQRISDEIARNFAAHFSSHLSSHAEPVRLSAMELLDIGNQIRRDFAPKPSTFNIPEVMLLPVDPAHLHAYWSLSGNAGTDQNENENEAIQPLTLRIYSEAGEQETDTESLSWFDVAIDSSISQQQVAIPVEAGGKTYSAAIGKQCGDAGFIEIAHSNVIHTPCGQIAAQNGSSHCLGKNASGRGVGEPA
jgi:hypothetical protein